MMNGAFTTDFASKVTSHSLTHARVGAEAKVGSSSAVLDPDAQDPKSTRRQKTK